MSGNVDTTILDHERWDLRANEAPVPAKTVHRLLDALEEAEKRAEEADRYRDNMSAALLMVGSEACGDPKIDPRDRGDPRWTPTLAEVADMRAELARLRPLVQAAKAYAAIKDPTDPASHVRLNETVLDLVIASHEIFGEEQKR